MLNKLKIIKKKLLIYLLGCMPLLALLEKREPIEYKNKYDDDLLMMV